MRQLRGGEALTLWNRSVASGSSVLRLTVPRGIRRGRAEVQVVLTGSSGESTSYRRALVLPR